MDLRLAGRVGLLLRLLLRLLRLLLRALVHRAGPGLLLLAVAHGGAGSRPGLAAGACEAYCDSAD